MKNTNSTNQVLIAQVVTSAFGGISLQNIAAKLPGIPVNTIRGSLTKLAKRGVVKRGAFGWRGRSVATTASTSVGA